MSVKRGYDPIPVNLVPSISGWDLLTAFLGHYEFRVFTTPEAYIDVGRGSVAASLYLQIVSSDSRGSLGSIGQFCDTASCTIMSWGNHRNDNPVNSGFGGVKYIQGLIQKAGQLDRFLADPLPVCIGNNVLLSRNCILLPGVRIADGCVIGAGAVVTKDTEPFGIYAGVPARRIADRPNADKIGKARWWDWSIPYIVQNAERLQELAVADGPHDYREPRPRFALRQPLNFEKVDLLGWVEGDVVKPIAEAPLPVREYIQQIGPGPGRYWLPDVWALDPSSSIQAPH